MKKILAKIVNLRHKIEYKMSGRHVYFLDVKSRIDNVSTQKKADIIEVELRRKLEESDLLKYEEAHLQVALGLLQIRRENI